MWNWVRRNKGKLAASGIAAGVGWYTYKHLSEQVETLRARASLTQQLTDEARNKYIYDSQQRAADDAILKLLSAILAKIEEKYDVEAIVTSLKINGASKEHSRSMWNKMLVMAVTRLVAGIYATALLSFTLKAQVSILAALALASNRRQRRIEDEVGITTVLSQYLPASVTSFFNLNVTPTLDLPQAELDADAHSAFLHCAHLFATSSLMKLCEEIERQVTHITDSYQLTDKVDEDMLKELLWSNREYDGELANFMVPDSAVASTSFNADASLTSLLTSLHSEITVNRRWMIDFAQACANDVTHLTLDAIALKVNGNEQLPLAHVVNILSNKFARLQDFDDFAAPLQRVYTDVQLHDLCEAIFNRSLYQQTQ